MSEVEALRKRMLLTISNMAEVLGVSRQGYYDWRNGRTIRPAREKEVRVRLKKLLNVMLAHDWPNPAVLDMEPDERFKHLTALLDESE